MTVMPALDHVLVTRFNLPSRGKESVIRAQEGWLRERVDLFLRYTVPSVQAQTANRLHWIVYFDPESPEWLVDRLAALVAAGRFTPLYREAVEPTHLVADARALTGAHGDLLLTTNLDNDDALASDFAQRLQELAVPGQRVALYLENGLIRRGDRVFLRRDRSNAFVSVAEPWDGAVTAWVDWHNLLHHHMPVRRTGGPPAWLQVVHGRNVSNRVRGRLVDPSALRGRFAGLLDDAPAAPAPAVFADGYIHRPLRETREAAKLLAKRLILAAFGKAGVDALKNRLSGARPAAR